MHFAANQLLMSLFYTQAEKNPLAKIYSMSTEIVVFATLFFCRRVSIVRGRVVTMTGQGLIGVRVSVDRTLDASNYGFTLSRPDGW